MTSTKNKSDWVGTFYIAISDIADTVGYCRSGHERKLDTRQANYEKPIQNLLFCCDLSYELQTPKGQKDEQTYGRTARKAQFRDKPL